MKQAIENKDVYSIIGAAIELNAISKYHQQFPLVGCALLQIYPAIKHSQIKIYYSDNQKPKALAIWAWINEDVFERICRPKEAMTEADWKSGSLLYFSDVIAPHGDARKVCMDLLKNIFPDENQAISVRRSLDGTIRKKNIWRRQVL